MADLADGESIEMQGSGRAPYVLKNTGGVYSCSCPAWRNQSIAIEQRTCKHLRKLRGDAAEQHRIGNALPAKPVKSTTDDADSKVPPLLLAHAWTNDVDLAGWWMSEKLDGVRAYWDGQQFLSRQGNPFHAPDWFVAQLPSTPLDGELWLARKAFQRTVSIVRRQDKSDHWREISYLVFDAPTIDDPFERRIEFVRETICQANAKHIQMLEHHRCRDIEHLRQELARVESLGGEGLMLRQPKSRYEAGRSMSLLKVKTFHDAEARIVDHSAGAGRHKGRLGALVVELADGTQFSVGTGLSDAQRENPPPIGSVITFRYQELSDAGVPRFPSFVRVAESSRSSQLGTPRPPGAAQEPANKSSNAATTNSLSGVSTKTRYFELTDGKSSKFWEISISRNELTVRFGKIGTKGQSQSKSFADVEAARRHADKLVEEKTGKGYQER